MNCPTCGAENPTDAQFCGSCGIPIDIQPTGQEGVIYCPKCGTQNSTASKFCSDCGDELR